MKSLDRLYLHAALTCFLTLAWSLDAPQKSPVSTAEQSDPGRKEAINSSKESQILQSDEPQGPSVQLNYGISADRRGILSCEVGLDSAAQKRLRAASAASNAVNSVYLMCPQVPTSICYFDCIPSCTFEGEGSAAICKVPHTLANVVESCEYQIINSATILVKYTVNMEALDSTGNWSCEYQGVRARPLLLQAAERQISTQRLSPPVTSRSPLTKLEPTDPIRIESPAPDRPRDTADGGLSVSKGPAEHKGESGLNILAILSKTRPEVILALIIVVVLTMLVNSALFVRCCLTSSYFDSLKRGKPDHGLGRLLCLESRSDKSYQRPEVTVHPLPVQPAPYYYQPQGSVTFLPHSDCSSKFPEPYAHVRPYVGRGGSGSDVRSLAGSQSDRGLPVRLSTSSSTGGGLRSGPTVPTCAAATLSNETLSITSSARGSREYFLSGDSASGHILPPVYCLKTPEGAAAPKEAHEAAMGRSTGHSKDQLRGLSYGHHYPPSTVSTTIYDDLSASSYHAVTPMLVRLPAGETGIILCHRPDTLPAGAAAMASRPTVVANDYTFAGCTASQVPPQSPSVDENCTVSTQSTESDTETQIKKLKSNEPPNAKEPYVLLSGTNP
ncbi:hypothetical protein AAHC03_025767 [Spirometra sp. Aus1]